MGHPRGLNVKLSVTCGIDNIRWRLNSSVETLTKEFSLVASPLLKCVIGMNAMRGWRMITPPILKLYGFHVHPQPGFN